MNTSRDVMHDSEASAPLAICLKNQRYESKYFASSLLESEAPERVRIVPDARDGAGFVYPLKFYSPTSGSNGAFSYFEEVDPEILDAVRARRAVLILDTSNEGGKFVAKHMGLLYDRLQTLQLPAVQVVYLTQNTLYAKAHSAWAASVGISEPIHVANYHCFLRQMANYVTREMVPSGQYDSRRQSALEDFASSRFPEKRYLCLNFTPRPHRVATLLFLIWQSLLSEGLVSFPGFANRKTDISARVDELLGKEPFPWLDELKKLLPQFEEITPLSLDVDAFARISPVIDVGLYQHYRDTSLSLVTESGVRSAGHRRFTEKPFKPVLGLHPFIVVGLPQTLAQMRQFGFQTFSPWIDETYDETLDDAQRIALALIEFERLCRLPAEELNRIRMKMLPAVLHNYHQFDGPLQSHFRKVVEEPLLKMLRALTHGE